jgi:hypothetical protein
MVRLVKGAYWDGEIKRAQLDGQAGYPVYTAKAYTDVAYLACAKKLLAAPAEIYPQFATHNAHTLAAVYALAGPDYEDGQYEFQCLHGMGEPLYEQVVGPASEGKLGRPCRIYAPSAPTTRCSPTSCGGLLENGANTSFVNRIASDAVPLEELVQNPVETVEALAASEGAVGLPHPAIVLPRALFGACGELARPRSRRRDRAAARSPPRSPSTPRRPGRPSRCSASTPSATNPIRCSIRPIVATSSAIAATPPRTTSRRRWPRPATPRPTGQRLRPRRAPRCSKAAPTGSRPTRRGW